METVFRKKLCIQSTHITQSFSRRLFIYKLAFVRHHMPYVRDLEVKPFVSACQVNIMIDSFWPKCHYKIDN